MTFRMCQLSRHPSQSWHSTLLTTQTICTRCTRSAADPAAANASAAAASNTAMHTATSTAQASIRQLHAEVCRTHCPTRTTLDHSEPAIRLNWNSLDCSFNEKTFVQPNHIHAHTAGCRLPPPSEPHSVDCPSSQQLRALKHDAGMMPCNIFSRPGCPWLRT
jgi:hypothetical protein